ncbi:ABC transporter ATP-binding protein [Parenemella sanctibonifatiensis]|uniref:Multidrug ABC transporter ATP-binding protein n=1 Tax=Parenemella sanctibonifatiensis TaxID=2016505 RepID=A0A255EJ43_9ACTN|nr:ABC transporter ATP-binding protein [Parenemella sanctibonifatiensis]OYN91546.1 multidrug ABC transporter ATP-binding protein [Parenemella sanctibonifatiensis]
MTDTLTEPRFEGSAESWRTPDNSRPDLPGELFADRSASWGDRAKALLHRYTLRRERAEEWYARTRSDQAGLPVAGNKEVGRFLRQLISTKPWIVVLVVIANVAAAVSAVLLPALLGDILDRVQAGDPALADALTGLAAIAIGIVLLQVLLQFLAKTVTTLFGNDLLARARESVVRSVLRLPLSRVESTSSGDLVTRVTRDVAVMGETAAWALPMGVVSSATVVITLIAMVITSPLLALPNLVALALFFFTARWYLPRALKGYVAEGNSYSVANSALTESVVASRTVESLSIEGSRVRHTDGDVELASQAERYTLTLRTLMFIGVDSALKLPLPVLLVLGGVGYLQGWVSLGQIAAAALYCQQLIGPLDMLLHAIDRIQSGVASTGRLLGISTVPPDRTPQPGRPADAHLVGSDLRFAYREGHDVLHGVDLDLAVGERLAIVGPSGSGKSTLGRLLAGINGPRTGAVTVGGVNVMGLPLDDLRTQVALVTQEHHVFVGSLRDNVILAREETATDEEVWTALQAVEARGWVERLPEGLDTEVGSGNLKLTPAQAQQVALARLVIADPHTLVLDEATSLIDPQTARHLEGSMASLLTGRTVVAIAHRLHTAHDADRIAVVIDGRIAELGSHDELLALDGEYAALWRAWTS